MKPTSAARVRPGRGSRGSGVAQVCLARRLHRLQQTHAAPIAKPWWSARIRQQAVRAPGRRRTAGIRLSWNVAASPSKRKTALRRLVDKARSTKASLCRWACPVSGRGTRNRRVGRGAEPVGVSLDRRFGWQNAWRAALGNRKTSSKFGPDRGSAAGRQRCQPKRPAAARSGNDLNLVALALRSGRRCGDLRRALALRIRAKRTPLDRQQITAQVTYANQAPTSGDRPESPSN